MLAVDCTVNSGEDLASFGGLPLTVESQVMYNQFKVNAELKQDNSCEILQDNISSVSSNRYDVSYWI